MNNSPSLYRESASGCEFGTLLTEHEYAALPNAAWRACAATGYCAKVVRTSSWALLCATGQRTSGLILSAASRGLPFLIRSLGMANDREGPGFSTPARLGRAAERRGLRHPGALVDFARVGRPGVADAGYQR